MRELSAIPTVMIISLSSVVCESLCCQTIDTGILLSRCLF